MVRVFIIAAGGTGGHLFPGIAVADELRRRDPATRVVFAGTPKGLESRLVPRAGYELVLLPILPLNGVGVARALAGLVVLPWGLLRAAALVRRLRPAGVLGVGGYAGGPVVLAAALAGVATVILEPNAKPGFTNRVLRPFVGRAACGGFAALPRKAHRAPYTLLAFGGSQGSRVLNEALVAALPHLPGPERLRIVHQTGVAMRDRVAGAYAAAGREAQVPEFLDDMEARFAEADLVLCRSGATTCAELTAAGKASVLVPFALAAGDHQRSNALALQATGAARMIEEKQLSGPALAQAVMETLETPGRLEAMEDAARAVGRPDAAARVADLLEGKA